MGGGQVPRTEKFHVGGAVVRRNQGRTSWPRRWSMPDIWTGWLAESHRFVREHRPDDRLKVRLVLNVADHHVVPLGLVGGVCLGRCSLDIAKARGVCPWWNPAKAGMGNTPLLERQESKELRGKGGRHNKRETRCRKTAIT